MDTKVSQIQFQQDETYIGEHDPNEEEVEQEDSENYDTEYSHISKTLDTEMR